MTVTHWYSGLLALALACAATGARAHDPVFGPGPQTLFKAGVQVHSGFARAEAGAEREQEFALELKYGLTADWVIGVEQHYADESGPVQQRSSRGDLALASKYRFRRRDLPGAKEAAAVSVRAIFDGTGEDDVANDGATDAILGLSYGCEDPRWYRWAAARYRRNGENNAGLARGDVLLLDLVGGIRPRPTDYFEPDWVWMLELKDELVERAERSGVSIATSGGERWFLNPGLILTYRNYALKTGVQLPVLQDLNGPQGEIDYRAVLELEGHF